MQPSDATPFRVRSNPTPFGGAEAPTNAFAPANVTAAGIASMFGAAATLTPVLYLTEKGDTSAVSVNDIHQGALGDCFLLSPVGEIAFYHSSMIARMIHDNRNGSQTVTLYVDSSGRLPTFASTAFKAVSVTVTDSFDSRSVNGSYSVSKDIVGNQQEIWPQVIEKAMAMLNGGYSAIANGGYPPLAMEELTGRAATYTLSPGTLTVAELQAHMAAGDLITMDTPGTSGLPFHLVGGHCYMFEGITGSGSSAMVKLGNPWGTSQPDAIPFNQLANGIVEVDFGRVA